MVHTYAHEPFIHELVETLRHEPISYLNQMTGFTRDTDVSVSEKKL